MMVQVLVPTILSGGVGSRLWPLSRQSRPKPFISLPDGQNLLQKTFLRAAALPQVVEVMTVTNRELFFQTEDALRPVNTASLATRFVLEPFGRNTAAACTVAALEVVQSYGADAVMLVLPADQLVANQAAFEAAVAQAVVLAQAQQLVTFGIPPTYAETGFGYIETRDGKAVRMHEKPPLTQAEAYIAAGNYYWNSGMFCFTAGTLLAEMQRHAPEVVRPARAALHHAKRSVGEGMLCTELLAEDFASVPDISLDYALIERSSTIAVVPCEMGWSDIGSWRAWEEISAPTDANGNRVLGEAELHDVRDCYIQSHGRIIGCVGVDNLVIVDTADALLVASRAQAQEVRHLFTALQSRRHEAANEPATVHRPWGTYTVIERGDGFKIKRLEVKPGGRLSLQSHRQRSEHWIVLQGVASVVHGARAYTVAANQSTYIPAGDRHRLSNAGDERLVMIEIQTGDYVGEEDITRFEDIYGRTDVDIG